MLNIAISGGIGSGKSTVTKYLLNKGYTIIDADKMSREMTGIGGKAIPYIKEHFGENYLLPDGSMDRVAMRDLIYRNPEAKKILEEGTTKVIISDINAIKKSLSESGAKAVFYDIPQLFENNIESDYDQIWTVVADNDLKKERIKLRDGIPENIIDIIIGSQAEDEYRISKSTEVITNNGSIEDLNIAIDKLICKYNI